MTDVFSAVADPTRRELLERLRTGGPQSVSDLAEPLPMSRQAVTKHLDALTDCGLIRQRRRGRLRLHELNPHPLRHIDEWLRPYAEFWDDRLSRLRQHLEDNP
jgi:DNA-binding transcriptional ArsR family regulator